MTRETKVGLVIAGAFVCLVGIVVASKWNGGDTPGEHEEQGLNPVAAAKGEPKKDAAGKKPPAVVPASSPSVDNGIPAPPLAIGDRPPLPLEPKQLPLTNDDKEKQALLRQLAKNTTDSQAAPAPMPMGDMVFQPQNLRPQADPIPPPNVLNPMIVARPGDNTPVMQPIEFPPLKPMAVVQKDPINAPSAVPKPPDVPMPAPMAKPDAKGFSVEKPLFSIEQPQPVKKDNLPPAKDPPLVIAPKEIAKPSFKPANDPPNNIIPTPPVIPPQRADNGGQLAVTPPIVLGGQKNLPVVKDWNTDVYVAKQGDMTFAILSHNMYGTDKYADALLAYNRQHSAGVKDGSAFQYNPPLLKPGQQVLKPPVAILERDYADKVRAAAAPGVPTIKIAAPTPLSPTPGIPGVSNPPAAASGRVYTVQNPSGESILDIAERTLGSHREWHRIATLNPQYQPQFRIPAGTLLKLP